MLPARPPQQARPAQPPRSQRSPARARHEAQRLRDPRLELGRRGELLALEHFRRRGFRVIARNVRTREGEIDMIVLGEGVLVFAEVKTRRARSSAGGERDGRGAPQPLEGLGARQRARLRRLALAWLSERRRAGTGTGTRTIRFDAVGVLVDDRGGLVALEHVEGAW